MKAVQKLNLAVNASHASKNVRAAPLEVDDHSDPAELETEDTKKVFEKEKAVLEQPKTEPETETEKNTKLNALLYHTSDDSVDDYKQQNSTLDLLARLYYDGYDPDDPSGYSASPSVLSSRAQSPTPSNSVDGRNRPYFARGISFDTSLDSHHSAITLKAKHPEFKFRRNNKTYLIGYADDSESLRAVEWTIQEMVIHGDTIVVLQVLDEKLDPAAAVDHGKAQELLETLEALNVTSKRMAIVLEVMIGRPQKSLKAAIAEYKPAMMVVGTHHFKSNADLAVHHHNFLLFQKTTISKYFLQYALVPVILVKPFTKHDAPLDEPIDLETYFLALLAKTSDNSSREKKKKRSRVNLLSPSVSRSGLHVNLVAPEPRGRSPNQEGRASFMIDSRDSSVSSDHRVESRSQSRTRSKFFKMFT